MRKWSMVIAGVALVVGACGGSEQYGSDELRPDEERGGGRLGAIEQVTPEPAKGDTPAPTAAPAPAVQRQGPTPTPVLPKVTVRITGQGYQPFNFRVFKGTTVRVENHDGSARTFTSDQRAFDSGSIPPGGSWEYVANTVGTFNFHDETRPFVVGQMEVVER